MCSQPCIHIGLRDSLTPCLVSLTTDPEPSAFINTLLFSNGALFIMYVLVSEDLMGQIFYCALQM
jgi:hypothetical protein